MMQMQGCCLQIQIQCPKSSVAASNSERCSSDSAAFPFKLQLSRRKSLIFFTTSLFTFNLNSNPDSPNLPFLSPSPATAAREFDEEEEAEVVHLFEETSPSVVFIKVLELPNTSISSKDVLLSDESSAKVEGTGSGFLWDKFGHIVTNYHVVAKLATDKSGLQCCKVNLVNAEGNKISMLADIIGFDPAYDLAVLKVNFDGKEIKPAVIGTSDGLHVGQSCFAIGNPYGYENTLTTGVLTLFLINIFKSSTLYLALLLPVVQKENMSARKRGEGGEVTKLCRLEPRHQWPWQGDPISKWTGHSRSYSNRCSNQCRKLWRTVD